MRIPSLSIKSAIFTIFFLFSSILISIIFFLQYKYSYNYSKKELNQLSEKVSKSISKEIKNIEDKVENSIYYAESLYEIKGNLNSDSFTIIAEKLAFDSGLVQGDWCPVHPKTFESKLVKNVHVIGDASNAAPMPKSAFSASTQGKVVAMQIARVLANKPVINPPKLANTCYSLLSPKYGISIAAVYNAHDDHIESVNGAGGVSPERDPDGHIRPLEAQYAYAWYRSQTDDVFK